VALRSSSATAPTETPTHWIQPQDTGTIHRISQWVRHAKDLDSDHSKSGRIRLCLKRSEQRKIKFQIYLA
jgi:hypothetical protein